MRKLLRRCLLLSKEKGLTTPPLPGGQQRSIVCLPLRKLHCVRAWNKIFLGGGALLIILGLTLKITQAKDRSERMAERRIFHAYVGWWVASVGAKCFHRAGVRIRLPPIPRSNRFLEMA